MDQIHFHQLPWPHEELVNLGETQVTLRITLSYFVEPNPGRKGWRGRYSYQSHALRFDVKKATDSEEEFRKRMNALALQGDKKPETTSTDKWYFGPKSRDRGSIHSDFLKATGAEIAARNLIAVYPVAGWWKERPKQDRSQLGAPYSLILSLETDSTEVDLWTPVATAVNVPIEVAGL